VNSALVAFPRAASTADPEDIGSASLAEIDAAIALVIGRVARRVRLAALPFADVVAATGLARARAAGVGFVVEPAERTGVRTITVGPLE
jgi:hypothetical protein